MFTRGGGTTHGRLSQGSRRALSAPHYGRELPAAPRQGLGGGCNVDERLSERVASARLAPLYSLLGIEDGSDPRQEQGTGRRVVRVASTLAVDVTAGSSSNGHRRKGRGRRRWLI